MLETLPIVKFGDPEPTKPGQADIEMENGTVDTHDNIEPAAPVPGMGAGAVAAGTSRGEEEVSKETPKDVTAGKPVNSGIGPDVQGETAATSVHSGEGAAITNEDNPGCSICTEDFTRGEDVRVLPCNHKYHPACIDPWLLNVSGTCPLW